ncbi:MAG: ClbS/DfsB family four-helix bundle protein [Herpetosiphonaceae bacterium]|nr:ClbS/DfsB family four-helix bundle protein [Herpetosiphonaceae bacterium]
MNDKQQLLITLKQEFDHWEELLAGMSEAQITDRQLPSNLSIKDVIAHLMAWQQRSIARLEAAQLNREPDFPKWPVAQDPDGEDSPDQTNAWIHETYRDQPWSSVHHAWRTGFLRFLDLGAALPDPDLFSTDKYPWMKGYTLAFILQSSYEHHHIDHLEPLLAWLDQHKEGAHHE